MVELSCSFLTIHSGVWCSGVIAVQAVGNWNIDIGFATELDHALE